MKAILISDHAKWCALMMNGDKKSEIRKGIALYKATKKLIDEYGLAEFYVYCTKDSKGQLHYSEQYGAFYDTYDGPEHYSTIGNGCGKVLFKFRCYKVEEITIGEDRRGSLFGSCHYGYHTESLRPNDLMEQSCLDVKELIDYLGRKTGCAIHISDLEIFDKPKELWDFSRPYAKEGSECEHCPYYWKEHGEYAEEGCSMLDNENRCAITKAPQSWCYIESEE